VRLVKLKPNTLVLNDAADEVGTFQI